MPSSFFELSVATTGLFTARGALNVVSHNIANADTAGYSRQVVQVSARTPLSYQNGRGMIGTGSQVTGIGQMRNIYLDTKYWKNNGILGEYSAKGTQNQFIQAILNETDETGFNTMINSVFGIIKRDLVPDSSSMTARLSLIESSQALAQYFNNTYSSLQEQQSDINQSVKAVVSTINNIGEQIRNLNKQITLAELDGSQANDLRDSRALLVDELSKYVNVEAKELELNKDLITGECDKRFQVTINGYDFVDHYGLNTLSCIERTVKNNFEDVDGIYDIFWQNGVKFNSEFSLNTMSGELKGLLVTRDGNNQNYPTAQQTSATPNAYGGMTVTFKVDSANRYDWPLQGNIMIDGKAFAYEGYSYDEVNNTMTIDIPPKSGNMIVGTSVVKYSGLEVSGDTVKFVLDSPMSINELKQKIKIGDMGLSGIVSLGADGRTVTITSCNSALNIGNLPSANGATAKVGQSVDYKGLPYFMSKLNTFVRGLARSFNLGQDAYGNQLDGVTGHYYSYNLMKYEDDSYDNTGYNFFTSTLQHEAQGIKNLDYHLITAGNFTVATELLNDPHALACALTENPDISDYQAIDQIGSLMHNPRIFREGEIGNFIESITGELGIVTQQALIFESTYTDVTSSIDYQRMAVSSVSLDEEMATMVYWQQIYNACAKMISTIDGIYNTLINTVG